MKSFPVSALLRAAPKDRRNAMSGEAFRPRRAFGDSRHVHCKVIVRAESTLDSALDKATLAINQ
jgi:hypothetical protein